MPNKMLTDKDIIKALEYCVCNLYKCPECPYNNETVSKCSVKLKFDSIDLINRQKGYIDGQKEELDYLRNIIKQKDMTIKIYEGIINNQEAELDKHKKHLNRNIVFVGSRGCGKTLLQMNQIESTINKIKAEAIKEFAERLKEKYKYHELCGYKVINGELDDLVKEMVGDTE